MVHNPDLTPGGSLWSNGATTSFLKEETAIGAIRLVAFKMWDDAITGYFVWLSAFHCPVKGYRIPVSSEQKASKSTKALFVGIICMQY